MEISQKELEVLLYHIINVEQFVENLDKSAKALNLGDLEKIIEPLQEHRQSLEWIYNLSPREPRKKKSHRIAYPST